MTSAPSQEAHRVRRDTERHGQRQRHAPPRPRRRRRAQHRRRDRDGPEVPGLHGRVGGDGAGGDREGRGVQARPDRPRRDAARHGGLRRRQAARRRPLACPDHLPHRARRHGRQGPRPHARRGRLRNEAVQPRGARRAHPQHPAPLRARRARVEPARVRGPRARRGRARGDARQLARRPHRHRVPAPALPDAQPAPRADPRAAARARVGLRLRRRRARARDLRLLPAPQARRPRAAADPHGARRRLRPADTAGVMSSLRARLLAAVLAITAVGLLTLAAITYYEQRNFQYDRIDQTARQGAGAVAGALAEQGIGQHSIPDRDGDHDGGPPRGGGPGVGLPAGTYGELRTGGVRHPILFDYGQNISASPKIPANVEVGKPKTISGKGHGAPRYRLVASSLGHGDVAVVAVPLTEVDRTLHQLVLVEGLVIVGVLLVLAAVGWIVVRNSLLPLDRIGHTAGRIAGGDLSHRVDVTDERTEVGRVGTALNRMLDRLEEAFTERQASEDRLRQFIADASHELRTPLASIRGYAELHRMGAAREPEDVAKAMRRIEDEAARMGVLVEDLLTLARLDEVADAPHSEVVRGALAADAVDDARATAPDRPISCEVDGETTVLGDAHQLRQVLANLLRNALVHTPDGTPIEVTARRDGDGVALEVRDHGPGLPTEDPSEIFERFWRSEGGRKQGRAGAGLGLAIVAGIVDAHNGRAEAANAPDGGASFVVRLPAA